LPTRFAGRSALRSALRNEIGMASVRTIDRFLVLQHT
jgi:hypothetical protein